MAESIGSEGPAQLFVWNIWWWIHTYLIGTELPDNETEIEPELFPADEYKKMHDVLHGLFLVYVSKCKRIYTATKKKLDLLTKYLTFENQNMSMNNYISNAKPSDDSAFESNPFSSDKVNYDRVALERIENYLTDDQIRTISKIYRKRA